MDILQTFLAPKLADREQFLSVEDYLSDLQSIQKQFDLVATEVARLKEVVRQWEDLDDQWDTQKIAKLLKIPLGQDILPAIEPAIIQLLQQRGIGINEGDICGRGGCNGVIEFTASEGCSCHINPPCASCTGVKECCPMCGWEAD